MAIPTEGIDTILERVYENSTTDRGTNLAIGLFTDTDLDETSTWNAGAGVTQPTGGGYAEKTLTDANWTVSSGTASYEQQIWQPSGADYTGTVRGYYIRTTGTTPRLLAVQYHSTGVTVQQGNGYKVTPSIDMSDGIPGITVNDGIELMLNLVFKNTDNNRGNTLSLGLYTNSATLTTSTILSTITTPSTGGYALKSLSSGSFTVASQVATYATQTWTASGAAYAAVYGYYIFTTGTTPKLLHIDEYASGPSTVADGESYAVDINMDGANI